MGHLVLLEACPAAGTGPWWLPGAVPWEGLCSTGLLPVSCSPEGSSVDKPTPQELAAELHGYIQRLRARWALVKIPPALCPAPTPRPTMPHTEATVQAILEIQPGPALPRLEKSQIQQDLVATRVGTC